MTNPKWYEFQKERKRSRVLFWRHSKTPVSLNEGDYFFFLIRGNLPRLIRGYGVVERATSGIIKNTWDKYNDLMGYNNLQDLTRDLGKSEDEEIAYYLLKNVHYVPDSIVTDADIDFDKSIMAGKYLSDSEFNFIKDNLIIRGDKDKEIEILKTEVMSLKIKVRRIIDFLSEFPSAEDHFEDTRKYYGGLIEDDDPLYDEAMEIVRQYDRASASLIQRRLSVSYARAARLLDMLEAGGIVGPVDGSKPREVYTKADEKD